MNLRKIENGEKLCSSCKVIKPLNQFHKDNSHKLIEPYRSKCKLCDRKTLYKWRENNKEHSNQIRRNYCYRLRQELLEAYGRICSCCGETSEVFLSLEHIGGGGSIHRRLKGNNYNIYAELRRLGFPKDNYTLLCMNCNFATRYGKQCPHQQIVKQAA